MYIQKLILKNFRQFTSKTITFEKNWTIIAAPNARGKSTIIEAIYMISNGESPWESNNVNIIRLDENHADDSISVPAHQSITKGTSRIEALIETDDELTSIALFIKSSGKATTKQFLVGGTSSSKNTFLPYAHCVLFSPDMIDLIMFEPFQRRSFLDVHASSLFPDYSTVSTNYKKVLYPRNCLLKSIAGKRFGNRGSQDTNSGSAASPLDYWTEQLISLGSEVIHKRLELIGSINDVSGPYTTSIVYEPSIPVHELDTLADSTSITDLFTLRLAEKADTEKLIGNTLVGPHRDDWHLHSKELNLNIYGSRGEKRIAIADILFKLNALLTKSIATKPLLLLDDIQSELDEKNTLELFTKKLDPDQQTIITTTHIESIPEDIQSKSHVITL